MSRTKRNVRVIEREVQQEQGEPLPLFTDVEGVDHLVVHRLEPAEDEGHIGQCEPSITEEGLKAKYGGGKYKLTPRDAGSAYVQGKGVKTVKIAGEPKFSNDIARRKWLKNNGVEEPRAAAAAAGDRPPSMMEMMIFMQEQAKISRAELAAQADARAREAESARQQRERESELSHKRQLELMQLQLQTQETLLKHERERLREDTKEQRERDREWMATIAAAKKHEAGADPLAQAAKLIELMHAVGGGGGEGDDDPLAALAKNVPAIMGELRRMGSGGGSSPAPTAPAGGIARKGQDLTVGGELGAKASAIFAEIQRRGHDPNAVFANVLGLLQTQLAASKPAPADATPPAAPARPPKPTAGAQTRPPKATRASKAATR